MIQTEALHKLIQDEGILLNYSVLPDGLEGMCHLIDGTSAIVIDERIVINERQYRTVLAEELGHHFTLSWNSVSRRKASIGGTIKYEKAELKAHRWAADYMIPTNPLLESLCQLQPITMESLAEHFAVDESLVTHKLEALAAEKFYWDLENGLRLVLTNLPDVYLYKAV